MNALAQYDARMEVPSFHGAGSGAPEQIPLTEALSALRRRKWTVALIALIVFAPAAAGIMSVPRYFTAESSLLIDTGKTEFTDLQAHGGASSGDTLMVHSQTDILLSRDMAGRVVDRLKLTKSAEVQAILHPKKTALSAVLGYLPGHKPSRPLTAAQERQVAIDWLLGHTKIRTDGRSYTIVISAKTDAAELSARIANTYSDAYLDFMRDLKIRTLARAHNWLNQQISELQSRVAKADQRVEDFRRSHDLLMSSGLPGDSDIATLSGRQMSSVATQLGEARNRLAEEQSTYDQVRTASQTGSVGSLPSVVSSPLVQRLSGQLADLESQRSALAGSDLVASPRLQRLNESIAGLRGRIQVEQGRIAASLHTQEQATAAQVDALEKRLAELKGTVTDENAAEVQLRQYTSEADAARAVYRDYLNRFEQTSAQAAMQQPDALLISGAQIPLGPAGPHRGQLLAIAGLVAFAIGSGGAIVLERMRRGMRSLDQLEQRTALFPLGVVPFAGKGDRAKLEKGTTAYTLSVDHIVNLLRYGDERFRSQVIMITSALAGEGKTFLSVSLAASVGRNHGRALIIDADVRRAHVAQSIRNETGFNSFSVEPHGDAREITRDILPQVDLLTVRRGSNGLDLESLERVIAEARKTYRLILVDMPPVLAIPDAVGVGNLVDGAVIAVRAQTTKADAVMIALRRLHACDVRVIGGILTQADVTELHRTGGEYAYLAQNARHYGDV